MIVFVLFVLGICFGSFVNALVWRLHKQINSKAKKPKKEYSILNGRSMCPHCKHTLKWYDLVPLLSWLSLKAKCRYCKKPISAQYPLVELIGGLVFVLSYLLWPINLTTSAGVYSLVSWLVASVGLLALAVYDFKWMRLPTIISLVLIVFCVVSRTGFIFFYESNIKNALLAWAMSVAIAAGFFFALYIISKGKWIGDGDITLGLILGTILADPILAMLLIFLASVLGLVFSLPTLSSSKNKLKTQIPYGPYLIASTFILVLYGQKMVEWYKTLIQLE